MSDNEILEIGKKFVNKREIECFDEGEIIYRVEYGLYVSETEFIKCFKDEDEMKKYMDTVNHGLDQEDWEVYCTLAVH